MIKTVSTTHLSEMLRSVATAGLGLAFMGSTSWRLTVLACVIIPPVSIIVRSYGRYLRDLSRRTQVRTSDTPSEIVRLQLS